MLAQLPPTNSVTPRVQHKHQSKIPVLNLCFWFYLSKLSGPSLLFLTVFFFKLLKLYLLNYQCGQINRCLHVRWMQCETLWWTRFCRRLLRIKHLEVFCIYVAEWKIISSITQHFHFEAHQPWSASTVQDPPGSSDSLSPPCTCWDMTVRNYMDLWHANFTRQHRHLFWFDFHYFQNYFEAVVV